MSDDNQQNQPTQPAPQDTPRPEPPRTPTDRIEKGENI
jgi:hypothetical protein